MIFKRFRNNRRETKEALERLARFTEEEREEIRTVERDEYKKIAKQQVRIIGKIDAIKDFPIEGEDIIEYVEEYEDED